ncbi:hypothetical protein AKJ35_01105 [candidate division MSBL1 archaeon SCGC-AAA833F18]|uniref:Uncharacterized protein n=1 Tax=candidate division MSBL1 archaeon SCGC-AAA833F18 TaxID=1698257 RepID=A0A133VS50_9EURY|nr:hypothetical protein AKJ35_01105 [candidate division MSBL1 archaeon SCGC-AAA833F18]
MRKIERVYREILAQALEEGEFKLTQRFLSERCETSIGNVNYALKPLVKMNGIEKRQRNFLILNPKKILVYWASLRDLERDLIYESHSDKSVREIESEMPPSKFTAYTGYKFRMGEAPADYSEVYVYSESRKVRERFPKKPGRSNIFVLKSDAHLEKFWETPLAQIYVDLWNLESWYAQEFIKVMEEEIDGILE